jgi:hypothetical protein
MNLRTAGLVVLLIIAALALWAVEPGASEGDSDRAARLIGRLGSDEFTEREAASKALDELGEKALPALRVAARSEDAEVRLRATVLIREIEGRRPRGPGELILGTWRGTEAAADEQGPFLVDAEFEFREDGTLSAELDCPDPLGRQQAFGEYTFPAEGKIAITFSRWGKTPRTFKITFPKGQMVLTDEKGQEKTLTRLK